MTSPVVYTDANASFPIAAPTRSSIATQSGYNIAVAVPSPKPAPDSKHQHRHHAYAAEATGLLLIGILLLILTLARYWSYIHWSMR
jgi:hypothetical protein